MSRSVRAVLLVAGMVILVAGTADVARAQEVRFTDRPNVVSANPFGLLFELFNAEYERALTPTSTAGFGGSFYPNDNVGESNYLNLDAFWRYYPSGIPFVGWSFGAKVGYTTDLGSGFGFGFDANHSWLLGADERFYVGIGFGLKRVLGAGEDEIGFVPTIRLVNVGFAF